MGKYLDIIRASEAANDLRPNDQNDLIPIKSFKSFKSYPQAAPEESLYRVLRVLEARCPDLVEHDRWHLAVADGEHFLAQWGEQAQALGWTGRDLFGLHKPPEKPPLSYRRLSRYDATGLIWLLEGRQVIALTTDTAAIRWPSGSVTVYRRSNKPAYGPLGDSSDDFPGSR
jgi:hypothetical protein